MAIQVEYRESAIEYFQTLGSLARELPDRGERKTLYESERGTPEYQIAWNILRGNGHEISFLDALREKKDSREITEAERLTLWAHETFAVYTILPRGTSKEKTAVTNFVKNAANRLVQQPQVIEPVISVWRSLAKEDDPNPFHARVQEEASRQVKKKWMQVSDNLLSEWVKVYANSGLAKDFAASLISSYFRGPGNREDRVEAQYRFTSAVIDLYNEPYALAAGTRIGMFQELLSPNSSFYIDILRTHSGWYTNDKEKLAFQKVGISGRILSNLAEITDLDLSKFKAGADTNPEYTRLAEEATEKEHTKALQILGEAETERRRQAMLDRNRKIEYSGPDLRAVEETWPLSLTLDRKNPLNRKYAERFGATYGSGLLKRQMERQLGKRGWFTLTVRLPGGEIFDLAIPDSLAESRNQLVTKFITSGRGQTELNLIDPDLPVPALALGADEYNGTKYLFLGRRAAEIDRKTHPLQGLEVIGFPIPRPADGRPLPDVVDELGDQIRRDQIRFLNLRGVRVPIDDPKLTALGYTQVDFNKDPKDPEKIVAKIYVGSTPYAVKLDRYFNLDLEGASIESQALHRAVQFTFLKLLQPILCDESLGSDSSKGSEIEFQIASRMGHLRWLTKGRKFTQRAVGLYFENERKDLFVTNFERMERFNRADETTYVSPVVKDDSTDLPPLVLRLPGVLKL